MNRRIIQRSPAILRRVVSNPGLVVRKVKESTLNTGGRLGFHFGGGRSPWVQEIGIFLTYRCNLRCKMCALWKDQGYVCKDPSEYLQEEMPADELLGRLREFGPLRPKLNLAGGEIFLYSGWEKFIRGAKALGFPICVITNGTMLDQVAEKLIQLQVDELSISVDGPGEVHDRIRGIPGTFTKIEKAVEAFNRIKAARHASVPRLSMCCTISRENVPHLHEMIEVAQRFQADFLGFLHLMYITDPEYKRACHVMNALLNNTPTEWSGFLTDIDGFPVEALIGQMERLKTGSPRIPILVSPELSPDQIRAYYRPGSKGPYPDKDHCRSPWHAAWVFPNGEVSPCSSYVCGTLRRDSFSKIWNNDRYRTFRSTLRKQGLFPHCQRCCMLHRF